MSARNTALTTPSHAALQVLRAVALVVSGFVSVQAGAAGPADPEAVARATIDEALAPLVAARGAKVTVTIAPADSRRNLAPCQRAVGLFPPGAKPVGRTLVGVRCVDGATWQTFVPATVRLEATVWQTTRPLRAGEPLAATDVIPVMAPLTPNDMDNTRGLASLDGRAPAPVGRFLQRATGTGRALVAADLKDQGRINPGDPVEVRVTGNGFSITTEGRAVGAADPGATLLVRMAGGTLVNGTLGSDRRVELTQ